MILLDKNFLVELKKALQNTNLKIDLDKLDADKDLFEQGVDSFDFLMMLYAIEEHFKIPVSDNFESEDLNTLNKIFEVVRN